MANPEYMRIPRKFIPQDLIEKYDLEKKFHNDFVYVRINKGMYGLKQAAVLAYEHLVNNLKPHGYEPIPHTIGLWRHKTRPTTFCLCVDDFGLKYFKKEDADHFLQALGENYKYSVDWTGQNFCGLSFDWHYKHQYVDVSMHKYVQKLLHKFQHKPPKSPVRSPYLVAPWRPRKPGERQYAPEPDSSPLLDKKNTTRIQSIVGSVLYYARAIDSTLLPALNSISRQQSKPTKNTELQCHRVLDYLSTFPNVFLRYHASDMQLTIDSDASYFMTYGLTIRYFCNHVPISKYQHDRNTFCTDDGLRYKVRTVFRLLRSATGTLPGNPKLLTGTASMKERNKKDSLTIYTFLNRHDSRLEINSNRVTS